MVFPWIAARGRHGGEETPAVRAYLGYLRDRPDSILGALRDIAPRHGATLVHCAAGKDRTGVVCMLALAVAGATREAIVADFLATGERHRAADGAAARVADLRRRPARARDEAHAPAAETMERVLELLDERHGGPLGWLEQAGFRRGDAAALRRRLQSS